MINVTTHSLKRYAQRIKQIEKSEVESYIAINKEQLHVELDKMFQNSRLIYNGKFNEKYTETNFRLPDNIILITDTIDSKIITLYRVDFGFDRETDMTILKSLLSKLNIAEEKHIQALDIVKKEIETTLFNKECLIEEIKTLEETLNSMKETLQTMDEYINKIGYQEKQTKAEVDILAKKIVYSNIYRKEMMELVK